MQRFIDSALRLVDLRLRYIALLCGEQTLKQLEAAITVGDVVVASFCVVLTDVCKQGGGSDALCWDGNMRSTASTLVIVRQAAWMLRWPVYG